MEKSKGARPFGMRDNLAYAAGDFGCNMSFALKGTMAIFWTQYMQMDSILYAGILLLCQIWDAVNDPLIGSMVDADRRCYKRNKFLQYIFVGSIGLTVGGACCFLPFPGAPQWAKVLIFVFGYVIWDAFYTIANVPYGSLLSLISDVPGDRAALSAWRTIGSLLGNVLAMVSLPLIIYDRNNDIVGGRVFAAALVMGVMGFIAFQLMIRNTTIRVQSPPGAQERPPFNVWKAMGNFLSNRPAVGASLSAMAVFIGMGAATTAVTVLFQSYFRNVRFSGVVMLFSVVPIVVFTPMVRKMVDRHGKKELSVAGSIVSMAACALLFIAPVTPDAKGIAVFVACQLANAIGMGVHSVVSWSLIADAIDYNEWKNGVREEGTIYAMHSFFRKLAQGFGPSLVLVVMSALGYVEADKGSQTFEVALRMRYLVPGMLMFSAVAQFLSMGLIYNLDKKTLERMGGELKRRKGAAPAPGGER